MSTKVPSSSERGKNKNNPLFNWFKKLSNLPKWFNFLQLLWIDPDNKHELVWDDKMCADTSSGATVRDLLVKGLKVTLSPTEQEVCYHSLILDMRIKSYKY